MLHQHVTNISPDAFREKLQGKKVVILYPRTSYRNLFLSYFLAESQDGLIYYRIPQEYNTLIAWLTDMVSELQATVENFGGQLMRAPGTARADALGQALAADLSQLAVPQMVFYLDEIDRVPQDADFQAFMRGLVGALPSGGRLVVNARMLTYHPWIEMVARDEVAILGTGFRKNDLMFARDDSPRPQLEVYAFGRGHALVNGRAIENWDGALPRNLFFFFMDNEMTTRNEIFTIFWPLLPVKEATNVFHVTKRKITERISDNVVEKGNYELTDYSGGFYRPADKIARHYDVKDFVESLALAAMTTDATEQERLYKRAIDIYKAPFLQTVNMPWVLERREKLRQMFVDALIDMARLKKRQHQWEYALGYFVRVLKEMPQREDIYREAMMMYANLNRIDDAVEQYRMLEDYLDRAVGVPPSRETRELYEQIRSGDWQSPA